MSSPSRPILRPQQGGEVATEPTAIGLQQSAKQRSHAVKTNPTEPAHSDIQQLSTVPEKDIDAAPEEYAAGSAATITESAERVAISELRQPTATLEVTGDLAEAASVESELNGSAARLGGEGCVGNTQRISAAGG